MNLRIGEIIKEKGMTMQQAADKMGFSRIGLYKHINGNPTIEILQRIATALEVDITELFEPARADEFTCPNCGTRLTVSQRK
ncbi:MAG: helix-turn-helix transcriptional regulator [Mangrovibacterium sp.]|nr:helix-turn-helix transcriptional regulator [Mangrovibacterium sp.]